MESDGGEKEVLMMQRGEPEKASDTHHDPHEVRRRTGRHPRKENFKNSKE